MGTRYTFMMSRDTTSEAARIRFSFLARLSPEERLREALALSDFVAALAEAGRRDRAKTKLGDSERQIGDAKGDSRGSR